MPAKDLVSSSARAARTFSSIFPLSKATATVPSTRDRLLNSRLSADRRVSRLPTFRVSKPFPIMCGREASASRLLLLNLNPDPKPSGRVLEVPLFEVWCRKEAWNAAELVGLVLHSGTLLLKSVAVSRAPVSQVSDHNRSRRDLKLARQPKRGPHRLKHREMIVIA